MYIISVTGNQLDNVQARDGHETSTAETETFVSWCILDFCVFKSDD